MQITEALLGFVAATFALSIAPGPDNLFVLTRSALQGRKAGIIVTLGLCTGLAIHTLAVGLGLATIFKTSEIAFSVLKYGGAGYMLYLAWRAFRTGPIKNDSGNENPIELGKLYRQGVILNVTNPKVSIFFLAFLPQFVDSAKGAIFFQILVLGGLFILTTIVVFGLIAVVSGTLSRIFMTSERLQISLNRIAGIVFVGIALKLALAKQN